MHRFIINLLYYKKRNSKLIGLMPGIVRKVHIIISSHHPLHHLLLPPSLPPSNPIHQIPFLSNPLYVIIVNRKSVVCRI